MMMRRMPCAFLEGFLHLSLYCLHVCKAFQYYALKPLKAMWCASLNSGFKKALLTWLGGIMIRLYVFELEYYVLDLKSI